VDLKTQIKDASTRCNGLLSAVAFNAAANLPGHVRVGNELDPFPIHLDMMPGLWTTRSIFDSSAATVSGNPSQNAQQYCGLSGITVGDARLCNYQNRTLKAEVLSARVGVSNKAAGNKRMTTLFGLTQLSSTQFDGSGCVVLGTGVAAQSYADSAAVNASCAAHSTSSQPSNLGVVSPEIVLRNIRWCKEGVGKCGSDAGDDKWGGPVERNALPQRLKLCDAR